MSDQEISLEVSFMMEGSVEVVYEKVSKLRGINRTQVERILEMLKEERSRLYGA